MINTIENKEPPVIKGKYFNEFIKKLNGDPLHFYPEIREKYGDYVKINLLPGFQMYMLFHPDAVQQVIQSSNYRKPDFFYNAVKPLVGEGVFSTEGDKWLKQRRIMQPAFLKKNIDKISSVMLKSIKEGIKEWDRFKDGDVVDISSEMTNLTIKVLSNALFSMDISDNSNELSVAFRSCFEFVSYKLANPVVLPLWFPTQRNKSFIENKKTIDSVIDKLIESRKNSEHEYNDLLDILLKSQDQETNEYMSQTQLKDELLTLILAGHDTTSAALTWTFYLITKHKDKKEILLNEIDSKIGSSEIDFNNVDNLEYLKMIFNESLRLYPPAWGQPREAINDDIIEGYKILKNKPIALSQYTTHRHPDFWEKPLEFYPEHFESEKVQKRHKFAYFPFGGGSRMCIGKLFAQIEANLIIAEIMQKFDFELYDNNDPIPDPTFTLIPKDKIKLYIKKRI